MKIKKNTNNKEARQSIKRNNKNLMKMKIWNKLL